MERAGPSTKGNPRLRTAGGQPVPGEETCDGHHQAVTRGRHGLEEGCRSGWHGAVPQDVPRLVHETDRHAPGMQVDPAGQWVRRVSNRLEVSSSLASDFFPRQHTTGVC